MDLHKSHRKETNENEKSVCLLNILVTILKKNSEQLPVLFEVRFLEEISLTEIIPTTLIQLRMFIEYMMKIHAECTTIILKDPTYLRKVVYKYNFDEKEEEYVFSNNMPFYIDVTIMCFMYIMQITKVGTVKFALNDLITIMKRKYHIPHTNVFDTPLLITESKIATSYPSVFIQLLYYLNDTITFPGTEILRKWNLTNIFCTPFLALIIPVIESEFKTPLALLLAMSVALDRMNKPSYVLYQRILALYTSKVFPRIFQLQVCMYWGIIYKEEDRYKFAPYFTTFREEAKKLISSVKANDTSVKYTLSQI
ncbi:hypothetical protein ALC60_13549 [Trachymyrmex zeteki]|uniref:Uncharacterized protein n=1 Tax=Mycetomoellerius zeteki TaxID=64791 RepID=A0A151WHY3_9HYME|nr:hypothetical protein ALC60_13549 [Trachymyrmex zeteki]